MEIPIRLTFRGITVAAFGVLLVLVGAYLALHSWTRIFGVGVFMVGVGLIALGATDGFSDYSPLGKAIYGVGITGFALGIPLTIYAFYYGAF